MCPSCRFDPDEDVIATAGYRDFQLLVLMLVDGIYRFCEIQVRDAYRMV